MADHRGNLGMYLQEAGVQPSRERILKGRKLLPEASKPERIYCHASQLNLPFLGVKLTIQGLFDLPGIP